MRIGRGYPQQSFNVQGQALGPREPTVVAPGFFVSTLSVNLAIGLNTNQRRAEMRFPLPGWDGGSAIDQLVGDATLFDNLRFPRTGSSSLGTSTREKLAMPVTGVSGELITVVVVADSFGAPTDNVIVSLQTDAAGLPSGVVLASGSIAGSSIPTALSEVTFSVSAGLDPSLTYWVVFSRDGALDVLHDYDLDVASVTGSAYKFLSSGSWSDIPNKVLRFKLTGKRAGSSGSFYGYKRNLGPFPPLTQKPLPSQQQLTVLVTNVAVQSRRLSEQRRFPLPGWSGAEGQTTDLYGQPTTTGSIGGQLFLNVTKSFTDPTSWDASPFISPVGLLAATITANVSKVATPVDTFICELRNNVNGRPGNVVLASTTLPGTGLATSPLVYPIAAGVVYWVVFRRSGALDNTNSWNLKLTSKFLGQLSRFTTSDSGTNWNVASGSWDYFGIDGIVLPGVFADFRRNLGPFPPLLVLAVPTQWAQTIMARSRAVNRVQAAYQRRAPRSNLPVVIVPQPAFVPVVTTLAVLSTAVVQRAQLQRHEPKSLLFPPATLAQPPPPPVSVSFAQAVQRAGRTARPTLAAIPGPTVVAPPPPANQQQQTLAVTSIAVRSRRLSEKSRYPLQGWNGQETIETGSAGTISFGAAGSSSSAMGTVFLNQQRAVSLVSLVAARVSTIRVWLARGGSVPTDNVVVEVQTDSGGNPSGVVLASASVVGSSLPGSNVFAVLDLSISCSLTAGTQYWLVFRRDGALSNTSTYSVLSSDVSPGTFNRALNSGAWVSAVGASYFAATTVGDNLGVFSRNLGPRPPLFLDPVASPPVVTPLAVLSTAVAQRVQLQRHEPKSLLFPPATLAQPPPVVTVLSVSFDQGLQQARRVRARSFLAGPTIVTAVTFVASPIQANLQENRIRGFGRRNFPASFLSRPQALQVFTFGRPAFVGIRPRSTTSLVAAPIVVRVPSVEQREQTINVALTHVRPRPTGHLISPPRVVRVASVDQREQTITTALARTRPRPTFHQLFTPVTATRAVVLVPVRVALAKIRPRLTSKVLSQPETLQVFTGARVTTVGVRPRPTMAVLGLPQVVRVPSVEQSQQTVRVSLARIRPRATARLLGVPVALQTFQGPKVALTKTTPRPTETSLAQPTVIRVASVEQREQTIAVTLVRARPRQTVHELVVPVAAAAVLVPIKVQLVQTRPRHVARFLGLPTVLQTFQAKAFALVQVRPRSTVKEISAPTVVIPLPTLQMQTVRTQLVRILPRPTIKRLAAPVVVSATAVNRQQQTLSVTLVAVRTRVEQQLYAGHSFIYEPTKVIPLPTLRMQTIGVFQPRIKPRSTTKKLSPPTRVIPLPTLRQQTIGVFKPRIKPRLTIKKLSAPTRVIPLPTLRMQTILVALVRIKPRKTTNVLSEPIVVSAGFIAQPLSVTLVHTRPQPTAKELFEPTDLRVPQVEQAEQTIRVALARIRPRAIASQTGLPVALQVFRGARVSLVETRPRATSLELSAPTVIRLPPVPYRIATTLVHARPRLTVKALFEPTVLLVPSVEQVEQTIKATLVRVRPRPIASRLDLPAALQIFQAGRFVLVEARPRPTVRELAAPVVVRQAPVLYPVSVSLARIRPRPTVRLLGPPKVLRTFATGRVSLVKTRPRPTSKKLAPPTRLIVQSVFQVQQTIRVSLVKTRPRPTSNRLAAPTKLAVQSVFQAQQTVRVSLVQIRPRPTTTVLAAPASVGNAFTVLGQQTVRVVLVATRPRPTVLVLAAPASVATTTRAVATLTETDPNLGETDASELTEATVSSDSTGTIAELTLGKATEGTVSESELTEAETEAT